MNSEDDTGEDAGAIENRLTLNPDDFEVVQDWEDGEEYELGDLPKGTKLRQISPGEFEVVPPVGASESEDEEEEEAPPRKRRGYPNPAVENLMRKKA